MTSAGSSWDAICVGAGITSLAFAAQVVASHPNAKILVVDKHAVAGGYASVFSRPKAGAFFDCSLHKLSGTGPGGNLRRIFTNLGLDDELQLVSSEHYFEAFWPGNSLKLPNDGSTAPNVLAERFPDSAVEIESFFKEVNSYGRHGYHQFQLMEGSYEVDFAELRYAHRHLKGITVADALKSRVRDPWLREILAATGIYVGGYPEDLGYLYFLHVVYATLCQGNAYVIGASQRLSNALVERVERAGGRVLLNTTVQAVRIGADGEVQGVETTRGAFDAPRLYINAAPHYAMEAFFANHDAMQAVRQRLVDLKPSRSTTTLYLTTNRLPSELGLHSGEAMHFAVDAESALTARAEAAKRPNDEVSSELAYWRHSPMEVTNYHLIHPQAGRVVCLNVLDSIDHWPERRDPRYKAKKRRAIDALLRRLDAQHPGLAESVETLELATPRTYERFTNNTAGAGYGAMVGPSIGGHVFHHQFPLRGVQFLSAWVAGPSYEAAFGYAEMKARKWAC